MPLWIHDFLWVLTRKHLYINTALSISQASPRGGEANPPPPPPELAGKFWATPLYALHELTFAPSHVAGFRSQQWHLGTGQGRVRNPIVTQMAVLPRVATETPTPEAGMSLGNDHHH